MPTDRQRELFLARPQPHLEQRQLERLYREAPGMSPSARSSAIPIRNFPGSYTRQDYIDSMEGATMSGHLAAAAILDQPARLATNAAVA